MSKLQLILFLTLIVVISIISFSLRFYIDDAISPPINHRLQVTTTKIPPILPDHEPFTACNSPLDHYVPIIDLDAVDFELLTVGARDEAYEHLINTQWKFVSPFCNLQDTDRNDHGMLHLYCCYGSLQRPIHQIDPKETLRKQQVICYLRQNMWFWSEPVRIAGFHGYIRCNIPINRTDEVMTYLQTQQQSLSILTKQQFADDELAQKIAKTLRIPVCVGSIDHHLHARSDYDYELSAAIVVHPSGDANNQSELRVREFVAYHLYQGFDHAYIFDHTFSRSDSNHSIILHALKDMSDDGVVTYIDWALPHFFADSQRPWEGAPWMFQFSAFAFAFNEYRRESKAIWISDFDLYLIPTTNTSTKLKQILSPLLVDNGRHSLYYEMYVHISYMDVVHIPSNIGCEPRFDTFLQRYTCYDSRYDRALHKVLASTNNAVSAGVHSVAEWKGGTKIKRLNDTDLPIFALHATDNVKKHLLLSNDHRNESDVPYLDLLRSLQCDMELQRIFDRTLMDFRKSRVYEKYLSVSSAGEIKGVVHSDGDYCWNQND